MIIMSMAVEDDSYVCQTKAKFSHIPSDLWNGFKESVIEQDMTLRRDDQKRSDLRSSNVINIADDSIGFDWLVPRSTCLIGLCMNSRGIERAQDEEDNKYAPYGHSPKRVQRFVRAPPIVTRYWSSVNGNE